MGGVFGAVHHADCLSDLFFGTDYHSHLGTRRGGLVIRTSEGFKRNIHDITNAQFRSKFEEDLPKLHGPMGLGVISDNEDQPLLIRSQHGSYAIVTVGRILNLEALARELLAGHALHFSELKDNQVNPTELVAALIDTQRDLVTGIRYAQERIHGSCTLLLLTEDAIYAARDRLGRTPLALGRKADGWAVTLETAALPNLGFRTHRFLGPGEIVRLDHDGERQVQPPGERMQICAFLWIYYGYPASSYEGINTEVVRNRCGAALARRETLDIDLVAGIPDSGIGHAIGYAAAAGIPYRRPFVKYTPTWPRSFMPQDQRIRDLVARMKLIPIPELIEGKRILFCEDSIVRGTQLRDIISRLFDVGARELHMRPACPPLVFGCKFLNFSQSKSELDLAARKAIRELEGSADAHLADYADPDSPRYEAMIEKIRQQLGLTSLRYQRLSDMLAAIGLPREKVCTYCWNGEELYGPEADDLPLRP
ncbi:MAG: amidophosphoribosyltransferase [Acidobacteria bacterium]|nr:amidophosphoribosyltransferase [Acidobacteriota bacterium]